jgi:hypothetical protein
MLCWVSVDLTLRLSILNKGYQTSTLTIICTLGMNGFWETAVKPFTGSFNLIPLGIMLYICTYLHL